jgi:hypothetical protein
LVKASRGTSGPRTLRRLNAPRHVDVQLSDAGVLTAVRQESGWCPVIELLDHYRTDDRWWTEHPVARAYSAVLVADGRTLTVFHDEIEGSWFEQRYG